MWGERRCVQPWEWLRAESGTPGAIRTRNLEIRSLSLYPLSYGGADRDNLDSIVGSRARLLYVEHAFDELMNMWPVDLTFKFFHRIVIEVAMELLSDAE